MREMKFRMPIFENGKFKQWHYWGWCGIEDEFISPHQGYRKSPSYQFTGLKDKNDKDIYEGSIIIHNGRNGYKPHEVIFDVTKAAFCGSYGINYPLQEGEFYSQSIEVVGNIHETPELLKP